MNLVLGVGCLDEMELGVGCLDELGGECWLSG